MKIFRIGKHLPALVLIVMSACIVAALAACTTSQKTTNTRATAVPTNVPVHISADLKHSPNASADLAWNAASHTLQVHVSAAGLAPNSLHPVQIYEGNCTQSPTGSALYTLPALSADAHGVGSTKNMFAGVVHAILANELSITIYNGPKLATALEARPIACGNINMHISSMQANQEMHLTLNASTAPDEAVTGTAAIQEEKNTLVVTLSVSGLVPGSTHMAHIHAGSCEAQGAVVYPLQPIVADAQGHSTTTTTIHDIKTFPHAQLYINVHEAGVMDGLNGMDTQRGFNPIACGNIAD